MLCDICHKKVATVHFTEIVDDKVAEMHICQDCTKAKTQGLKGNLSIPDLLSGIIDARQEHKDKNVSIECDFCGLTYDDFRKKARLGCGRCYSVFKIQLIPLLKKIHGSTYYAGKSPLKLNQKNLQGKTLKELKARLERAINLEEYEEAARLRDELKRVEQKSI